MALLGVLAGVRGNAEALGAVLAALERRRVARLLCAGDIVGYNADPAECVALLRGKRVVPVAGRNDLIAVHRLGLDGCSSAEIHSLKRTRRSLTPEAAAWLRGLPTHQVIDGTIALVHGGVRDIGQPMSDAGDIRQSAEQLRYDFPGVKLCFFGRDGGPGAYEVDGNVVHPLRAAQILPLERQRMHFVHPGSIDAQGRGEQRGRSVAQFAIFDTLEWTVEFASVPYDAASTEAKAAVFGYRMTRLAAGLYALRRGWLGVRPGEKLPRSGGYAPAPPRGPARPGSASTP